MESFQRELQNVTRRSAGSMVTVIAHLDAPGSVSASAGQASRRRIGSGILIDSNGSIITTFSNIDEAYHIEVQTAGGRETEARYLGADRLTNIALLQIDDFPGRPARLGESGLIIPGSPVVMVGGPLASTSAFGSVELDGGLVLRYSEVEMFRTNTPLFPGSIGAAVVGMDGRVVGMVAGSLTSARTISQEGLSGFIYGDRVSSAHCSSPTLVVPIEKAQEIAAELRMYGRVTRGFLGVQMGSLPTPPPTGPGQRGRLGIVILRVLSGSPADLAGLRPGDRIVRYSGSEVEVPDELSFLIGSTRPGSRIPIAFERNGEVRETLVELGYTQDLAERRLNRLRDPVMTPPPAPDSRVTQRLQTGRSALPGVEQVRSGTGLAPRQAGPARPPAAARTDTTRPNGH